MTAAAVRVIAVALVGLVATPAQAQSAPPAAASAPAAAPPACSAAEHRQFDFWLGRWEVFGPAGRRAGINHIERVHGGCVLRERYETGRGYSGESLNIYDAGRKVWHQTWADSGGLLLMLEGGLREGVMVMEGRTTAADGQVTRHRITWSPNADGSVRQHWQTAPATGDWSTAFDGRYVRLP